VTRRARNLTRKFIRYVYRSHIVRKSRKLRQAQHVDSVGKRRNICGIFVGNLFEDIQLEDKKCGELWC
jgi:hypothetical protein